MSSRILVILLIILSTIVGYGQPGQGGGPPGGGGPGGGQGNDPCDNPNPPPSCNNVPIDDDIWVLIVGGVFIGGYYVIRQKRINSLENNIESE